MESNAVQQFLSGLEKTVLTPGRVFLLLSLFSVAYFIFAHEGFYWIDDYGYAKYAWQVKEGFFSITQNSAEHPNNPLTHRLLIYAPVAVFYKLFGLNIYTTTLWPLLCTIGSSGIVYLLFRKDNPRVAVLGILLLGLYFHNLYLATYLYPDNILMFFSFAAAAVLYKVHFGGNGQTSIGLAVLFAGTNFAAFLSKETIFYFLPFYAWLIGLSFFGKKHSVFWAWSAVFGFLLLAGYFSWYHFQTGDWLFRFHIIEAANRDMQGGNYLNATPKEIISRLTKEPLLFLIGSGLALPLVFALGLFRHFRWREFLKLNRKNYFWLALFLVTILQFWFGSTSFSAYNPITLLPRMVTPAVPPLCLAAAFGLDQYFNRQRSLSGFFALLFGLICFLDRSNTVLMYAPLALFFGLNWIILRRSGFEVSFAVLAVVLAFVLSLRPLHFMRKETVMAFPEQDRVIRKYLNGQTGRNLVLTDRWLQFIYDFHYDFQPNPHFKYQQFQTAPDFSGYDHVYLLLNRGNLSNPDMAKWQPVQEPVLNRRFPQKKLIAEDGKVLLYRLK